MTAPARTSRPTRPLARCTSASRHSPRFAPATPRPGSPFEVPDEAFSCGFTEAVRGVLSHHMVIKGGKIANYHPYPPTPWNASVRDVYGTPGPYEDAVQNTPIFEENSAGQLQGHRHHARGAQLRPVPAVRRAHVSRPGQDPADDAQPADADDPGHLSRGCARTVTLASRSRRCSGELLEQGGAPAADTGEELVRLLVEYLRRRPGPDLRDHRCRPARPGSPAGRRPAGGEPADPARAAPARRRTSGSSAALDRVRPYLGSHAGGVAYLGVDDGRGRPPAAGRQLPRLRLVDRDGAPDDRGGRAGGRSGAHRHRGRR